ncbi:MAG TPA: flavodoxin domain-containing protein [Thermodesulfobacteriota bacterium]|nr:flavodoxin domain-containing protein [Thermodesulfobacteriota bacterium]HOC38961.1 flavodoxin domain-containing protein [Thermodesulfobacteriota bacterium]
MKPVEIRKGIYCLPAIDWNMRDFHGYATHLGSTYNAYLLMDEKITLIDTVKAPFVDELLDGISQIVDPSRIEQVVSNHTEMDHSGGLPKIMERVGRDKPVYCSQMGLKNLPRHFLDPFNYRAVQNGDVLALGKWTLTFLETRMLHWPDSMVSYLKEERILFSSDAFGQHYASLERFDDQVGDRIMPHALKYWANILMPYADLIVKLVEKIQAMGLQFDMLCPDHGIIWRADPGKIINTYVTWSKQQPQRKAVVVYDTMWQSTQKMAEAIIDGLAELGVDAQARHLRSFHRSDVVTDVADAGAVIVGSPTLNNGMFPTVSDFLCYYKGLRPKPRIGAAFGSYGWSGEAVKQINEQLKDMKFELGDDGLRVVYVPDSAAMESCRELGRKIGRML